MRLECIAVLALLLSGAAARSQPTQPCVLTHEKVANVYQGSAPESVEYALGCKLQKRSSSGFGDYASTTYEATDARGSTFTAFMNSAGRLRDYHFYMR